MKVGDGRRYLNERQWRESGGDRENGQGDKIWVVKERGKA